MCARLVRPLNVYLTFPGLAVTASSTEACPAEKSGRRNPHYVDIRPQYSVSSSFWKYCRIHIHSDSVWMRRIIGMIIMSSHIIAHNCSCCAREHCMKSSPILYTTYSSISSVLTNLRCKCWSRIRPCRRCSCTCCTCCRRWCRAGRAAGRRGRCRRGHSRWSSTSGRPDNGHRASTGRRSWRPSAEAPDTSPAWPRLQVHSLVTGTYSFNITPHN